jgi:hypothetical protein
MTRQAKTYHVLPVFFGVTVGDYYRPASHATTTRARIGTTFPSSLAAERHAVRKSLCGIETDLCG